MLKTIAIVHKRAGMSREEFYRYWKDIHGPLALKMAPQMKKYVQNHFIPGQEYEGDGIVESWYDDMKAFQEFTAYVRSPKGKALAEDADKFADMSKSKMWLVEEHIIKA
jgi:uncharacterized protein (TIGR02118 family)